MNHLIAAALVLWVISGIAYRQARRRNLNQRVPGGMWYPMPMACEDQLDIAIHCTQITERYPFTKVKS